MSNYTPHYEAIQKATYKAWMEDDMPDYSHWYMDKGVKEQWDAMTDEERREVMDKLSDGRVSTEEDCEHDFLLLYDETEKYLRLKCRICGQFKNDNDMNEGCNYDKNLLIKDIFTCLELTQPITKSFISHLIDMAVMFDKKQSDYGSNNISDFGELGVIVRMNDKMARIKNLTKDGKTPQNESLDDSFSDISNYGVIALMLRNGEWK